MEADLFDGIHVSVSLNKERRIAGVWVDAEPVENIKCVEREKPPCWKNSEGQRLNMVLIFQISN